MKECYMYYKQECLCKEDNVCYDKDGSCEYSKEKEVCKNCTEKILPCYICDKK